MSEERQAAGPAGLNREELLKAFQEMSEELRRRDASGEICLFGGTVMVLAFTARLSTKDVDGIFEPAGIMREVARDVGAARGWPPDWLNDAAKGFISERHEIVQSGLPQFSNLRLTMPVPEYLLAMKCMAARIGTVAGEADDISDIVFLIRLLKLRNPKDVLEIVSMYYPKDRIPVKTQYLVDGLFEEGKV